MESERERQPDPPASWQEHWFDHHQLLELYYSDDDCAIYLDPNVRRRQVRWNHQTPDLIDAKKVQVFDRMRGRHWIMIPF